MDAVGAAASILALVELSLKVISLLGDVKNASSDRARILAELRHTSTILASVAESAKKNAGSLPNSASLVVDNGPLMEYKLILEELVARLEKGKGVRDIPKKLMFVARREDIGTTLALLARYKATFIICLQEDTLGLLLGIGERSQKDSERLLSIKGTVQQGTAIVSRIDGTVQKDSAVMSKIDRGVQKNGQEIALIGHKVDTLLTQSKSELVARPPLFLVPFEHQPDTFVGREEHLAAIKGRFESGNKRVALYGLGGVGKSRIAMEYLYRLRKEKPATSIFWVHASDKGRFVESYQDIALEIPESFKEAFHKTAPQTLQGCSAGTDGVLALVRAWLSKRQSGHWLLILDNADNAELFATGRNNPHSVLSAIPHSDQGQVLITSRSYSPASQLVNQEECLIHVLAMPMNEGISLLRKMLPKDRSPTQDFSALAKSLDFLPLALKQAAAYIQASRGRTSISRYLALFRESEYNARNLLEKTFGDTTRDSDLTNAVILTWQLSFDFIKSSRPSCADLLSLMSLFNRYAIPISLFRNARDDELQFEDDLNLLSQYSLIDLGTRWENDIEILSMHRLV